MTNTNDPYKTNGQNTHAGSTNQGRDEAQKGWQPSPQQPGESAISYQTRMNAYNQNKS
ncbi:hypothetical protein [Pseudaestuariivita rosea]|uniref:hypothetical protein n=1 Tax=Pseudaestuariivita rosea TaxID=2763263 RepID=UPI001ABA8335|nr:hypothetical protein [Pseudaestuariivita rosea]